MQPVHDRMPVIMPADHYVDWLNKAADENAVYPLLLDNRAYGEMSITLVSDWVNNPQHDAVRCITSNG
jgi:putative SOS response-associated peptidase YedK